MFLFLHMGDPASRASILSKHKSQIKQIRQCCEKSFPKSHNWHRSISLNFRFCDALWRRCGSWRGSETGTNSPSKNQKRYEVEQKRNNCSFWWHFHCYCCWFCGCGFIVLRFGCGWACFPELVIVAGAHRNRCRLRSPCKSAYNII